MTAHIVHILKESQGFCSGEVLSRQLGVTRAAVWKHVEELRRSGYSIEAVPRQGYRLLSCPDRLSGAEIKHGLGTVSFGQQVHYFDSLDSTMTEAFRLAMEGAPEGSVVIAETQIKGKGRLGRTWTSPKAKGIYLSVILRPTCTPMEATRLTLLAAVVVSEAIEKVSGVRALIKWPNDLLVGKKKVCGILTEMSAEMDRVRFVVLGIGVNVNSSASQLVPEGTSLKIEKGLGVDRVLLCQEILRSLELRYSARVKGGYKDVWQEWRQRSITLGRKVFFTRRGIEEHGEAMDIDEDGGLLIRTDQGVVIKHMAGDVRS